MTRWTKQLNDEKGSPDEYNEFEPQLPNFGMGTGFFINKIVKDLARNNRCIISTKI